MAGSHALPPHAEVLELGDKEKRAQTSRPEAEFCRLEKEGKLEKAVDFYMATLWAGRR